jgi:uncharacterized protein with gpF-like domain
MAQLTLEEAIAKLEEQKHLADAVDAKEKEIARLKEQIVAERTKQQNDEKDKVFKNQIEEKDKLIKKLIPILQAYQGSYRAFLKNIQGGLENAIELEALLNEKLK